MRAAPPMPPPTPDAQLEAVFRAHAPPGAHAGDAGLEASLVRLFEAGRRAWPAIGARAPGGGVVRQLAERGAAGPLAEVHAEELYLACACA